MVQKNDYYIELIYNIIVLLLLSIALINYFYKIYNLIETDCSDFLVLEYIEGNTLTAEQFRSKSNAGQLDIVIQIVKGLQAAHRQNVIHRDIKPENIIMTDSDHVKILDFGISRISTNCTQADSNNPVTTKTGNTSFGSVMGTLNFMSPEQASGKEITTATDMYSLGLLLQTLLSDIPPYPESSTAAQLLDLSNKAITQVPSDIPRHWIKLIQALKPYAPTDRPTASSTLDLLNQIQSKPAKRLKWIGLSLLVIFGLTATWKYVKDLEYERLAALRAQQKSEQVVKFLSSMFQQANPYDAQGMRGTPVVYSAAQGRSAEELKKWLEKNGYKDSTTLPDNDPFRRVPVNPNARPTGGGQ